MTAIYLGDLPDEVIEQYAAQGNPLAIAEAKQRGLVIKTASIDEILEDIEFEWLEE